jgi:serine/threonine protein kinase
MKSNRRWVRVAWAKCIGPRDTRLGRDVAIQVLPAHLSSNPDLRQRMEREAKAISSLNHPYICTLHDIGSQGGVDFMVMEHLEGETLFATLPYEPLHALNSPNADRQFRTQPAAFRGLVGQPPDR